jgi:NADH-quinone oxidoreductase subunit N
VIVLGSAASLAYYLRVLVAVWMRPTPTPAVAAARPARAMPALAGGSSELDPPEGPNPPAEGLDAETVGAREDTKAPPAEPAAVEPAPVRARSRHWELTLVAVLAALATLATGIYPDPLFDLVRDAGESFRGLL